MAAASRASRNCSKTEGGYEYSPEGSENNLVTDATGKISVKKLPVGTYYLEETEKTPSMKFGEFELKEGDSGEKTWNFSGGQNGAVVNNALINNKKKGDVLLVKYDGETNEALSGAKFDL